MISKFPVSVKVFKEVQNNPAFPSLGIDTAQGAKEVLPLKIGHVSLRLLLA